MAGAIAQNTGKETRALTLGHLLRGGTPSAWDRVLGMRFGAAAIRAVADGKFGHMVAIDPPEMTTVPLEAVTGKPNQVPLDWDVVQTAREMGICLGE